MRLAALCRELDVRGVCWTLSNSDTDFVRSLHGGFRVINVAARREINLKSNRRDVREVLISNA
jgi:DNA adenine methylase